MYMALEQLCGEQLHITPVYIYECVDKAACYMTVVPIVLQVGGLRKMPDITRGCVNLSFKNTFRKSPSFSLGVDSAWYLHSTILVYIWTAYFNAMSVDMVASWQRPC